MRHEAVRSAACFRAQLTVWLALLITLCLAAFAFYLYVAVSHSLTADLDQTLRVQAQQITATYEFTDPHDRDYKEDVEDNQQLVDTSVGSPRAASRVWIEVLDTRGHLLTHSSNLGPRHVPLPAQAWALLHAGPRLATQAVPGEPTPAETARCGMTREDASVDRCRR
jgi:hypothetical protein